MTHDQLLALTGDQIKYFDFSLKWPDLLKQQIPFGFPLFLRLIPNFRALRVALTKIQDPALVFGLIAILWLRIIKNMTFRVGDLEPAIVMLRWVGLWTAFSIGTLLLVQFPDDRYMQICYLWLPSMIGCAIGMIW